MEPVAEGLVRSSLRPALRAVGLGISGVERVRSSRAAVLLGLLFGTFIVLIRQSQPVTTQDAAVRLSPLARDVAAGSCWPTTIRAGRRPVKPNTCGWLLLSCLLCGDIEANPGPGRDINLLVQNVQSIKNKIGDLRQSAAELQRFSVVAMTETWLNGTVESTELESAMPSHVLLRRDRRDRVGGGVACFVDRSLDPERRETLEPKDAEMLVVAVRSAPPMLVAVCYCPPDDGPALAATMTGLHNLVGAAAGKPVVAVGDFNVPDVSWRAGAGGAGRAEPVVPSYPDPSKLGPVVQPSFWTVTT